MNSLSNNPEMTVSIDWLSVTVKSADAFNDAMKILALGQSEWRKSTPRHGYTRCLEHSSGILCMWQIGGGSLGCHVVFSGQTIRNLDGLGKPIWDVAMAFAASNANITRLDVAFDLFNFGLDIISIYEAMSKGGIEGTASKCSLIQSGGGGATCYVGSRSSTKMARLYNKGVESEVAGDWSRLEVEFKKELAAALVYGAYPTKNIKNMFAGAFSELRKTSALLGAIIEPYMWGSLEVVHTGHVRPNATEKWLLGVCAPALANHVHKTQSFVILEQFIQLLADNLGIALILDILDSDSSDKSNP